jgi:hypothetical protein
MRNTMSGSGPIILCPVCRCHHRQRPTGATLSHHRRALWLAPYPALTRATTTTPPRGTK